MVRKLYVGNLPFTFTENGLKETFCEFGTVESVKIVTDNFDGRSKGFAFVEMSTPEEANAAIEGLNGKEIEGRTIRIDLARPKESRPRDGASSSRGSSRPSNGDRRSSGPSRFGNNTERRNRW